MSQDPKPDDDGNPFARPTNPFRTLLMVLVYVGLGVLLLVAGCFGLLVLNKR